MENLCEKKMCHITKKMHPSEVMIRFVLSPSNVFTLDLFNEFDGKEFYVLASRKILVKMKDFASNKFGRDFQQENLISRIDSILLKRIVSLIALSRKAGKVIIGHEQIQRYLLTNKIELLLQARDGSENRKKNLTLPRSQTSRINCLNRKELGIPFRRDAITNVGFLKSSFTNPLIFDTARLGNLRSC